MFDIRSAQVCRAPLTIVGLEVGMRRDCHPALQLHYPKGPPAYKRTSLRVVLHREATLPPVPPPPFECIPQWECPKYDQDDTMWNADLKVACSTSANDYRCTDARMVSGNADAPRPELARKAVTACRLRIRRLRFGWLALPPRCLWRLGHLKHDERPPEFPPGGAEMRLNCKEDS